MKEKKCDDCLAHYPEGFQHTCPPWMKALVTDSKSEDPLFGAYETRLLVFLETDEHDGFRQVMLTPKQFKEVSDAVIREIEFLDGMKPGMESVSIELSEERYPAEPFDGLNSINY